MDTFHNPDRFVADLRKILSQGRKRIGFLIGAGAPMSVRVDAEGRLSAQGDPLIPGVERLTASVIQRIPAPLQQALNSIRQEMDASANIESILSRIRLLSQALGTATAHGLNGDGFRGLATTICKEIGSVVKVPLPAERTPYSELVAWVSGTLRQHSVEIFTTNYDLLLGTMALTLAASG